MKMLILNTFLLILMVSLVLISLNFALKPLSNVLEKKWTSLILMMMKLMLKF